jgi:RND family efflux transporter MFP subunit
VQVRAPIDGVVASRSVSVGDVVAPGLPLFVVIDPRSLRLEASVPAASVGDVHPGGAVTVEVQGYTEPFTGTIARVAPAVDPATRQLSLLVDIPNPNGTLIAGLFASGRIAVGLHDGLVLPADAISGTGDAAKVLRIRDGVVEEVAVRLGVVDAAAEKVEVIEGLAEGDRVLVGQARDLAIGSAVTLAGEG